MLDRTGLENTPFSVECAAALTAACVLRAMRMDLEDV